MTLARSWLVGVVAFGLAAGCGTEDDPAPEEATAALQAELVGGALGQLNDGDYLFPGQRLVAPQCYYHLEMQYDGNLVTYGDNGSARWKVWDTSTYDGGWNGRGGYVTLQSDGNIVVYNWNDEAVWADNVVGGWSQSVATLQVDGNWVERSNPTNGYLWDSGSAHGPGVPTGGCQLAGVKTHVERALRDGTVLGSPFSVPRQSWCGYYCAQDSSCKSYTVRYNTCTLRSTVGTIQSIPSQDWAHVWTGVIVR
jgi:hypothetical protein